MSLPSSESSSDLEEVAEQRFEEENREITSVSQNLKERMAAVKGRLEQMKRWNAEAVLASTLRRKQEWEEEEKLVCRYLDEVGIGVDKRYLLDNVSKMRHTEAKKRTKTQNASFGWEQFNENAMLKSYQRRLRRLKFDPALYAASQSAPHFPPSERANSMAIELESERKHRHKFSRHRAFYEDMDINFMNERNRVYNLKLERHFAQYVADIKSRLGRGQAL